MSRFVSCRIVMTFLLLMLGIDRPLRANEVGAVLPFPLVDLELQDRGLSDEVGVDHTVQGQSSQQQEQVDTIDARIEKLLDAQANLKPGLQFGYQKGFTIASPAGVNIGTDVPFSMRINSWFQFRHTGFASHGPNENQNDLELGGYD